MFGKVKKIHFVGAGGIGMSGIAEILITMGFTVSGSDLTKSDITDRLEKIGAKIYLSHSTDNVINVDVVVVSSAIRSDNVEVIEAKKRKIPVIKRAEMLSELIRMKYGIAIAGSHGKTTTTSIVSSILLEDGLDPTVVVGGKVQELGGNARLGEGKYIIAEADESDGSFLMLIPYLTVITNIDKEHLDFYQNYKNILTAFAGFANRVPFYGANYICGDDKGVREIIPFIKKRFYTYGFSQENDIVIKNIRRKGVKTFYDLDFMGERIENIGTNLWGKHNILNSAAAISIAKEINVKNSSIINALDKFSGVARRMEVKYSSEDYLILDDYGHHPVEINATITALKEQYPEKRLVVAFQPHRYSRTRDLMDEFATSFNCDLLIITDIYAASETPIEGVSGEKLFWKIKDNLGDKVHFAGSLGEVEEFVKKILEPGDIFLTLGAGNIVKVSDEISKNLKESNEK